MVCYPSKKPFVHSVSSVVNPPRTNRPTFLVPLSVDFSVLPWPTPRARQFSLLTSHFLFLTSQFAVGKRKKPAGRMGQLASSISKNGCFLALH